MLDVDAGIATAIAIAIDFSVNRARVLHVELLILFISIDLCFVPALQRSLPAYRLHCSPYLNIITKSFRGLLAFDPLSLIIR